MHHAQAILNDSLNVWAKSVLHDWRLGVVIISELQPGSQYLGYGLGLLKKNHIVAPNNNL